MANGQCNARSALHRLARSAANPLPQHGTQERRSSARADAIATSPSMPHSSPRRAGSAALAGPTASNGASPKATACRASSARAATRSTTRIRRSSSAACRSGRSRCCCASARSSLATACGRCRRAFSRTARRVPPARCARRSRRRTRGSRCGELYTVISLPQINQIYMMFRARLADLDFGPGPESLEVRLCSRGRDPVGSRWRFGRSAHAAQLSSSIASSARFRRGSAARAEAAARRTCAGGVTGCRRVRGSGAAALEYTLARHAGARRHDRVRPDGTTHLEDSMTIPRTCGAGAVVAGRARASPVAARSRPNGSRSRPAAPAASTTRWAAAWPTSCPSTSRDCRRPPKSPAARSTT